MKHKQTIQKVGEYPLNTTQLICHQTRLEQNTPKNRKHSPKLNFVPGLGGIAENLYLG